MALDFLDPVSRMIFGGFTRIRLSEDQGNRG